MCIAIESISIFQGEFKGDIDLGLPSFLIFGSGVHL